MSRARPRKAGHPVRCEPKESEGVSAARQTMSDHPFLRGGNRAEMTGFA
jgi:hypothetical protein